MEKIQTELQEAKDKLLLTQNEFLGFIIDFSKGKLNPNVNPYSLPQVKNALKMLAEQVNVKEYLDIKSIKSRLEGLPDSKAEKFEWRLPTKKELAILNDNMDAIGGFDKSKSSWYWSSTEYYNYGAWGRRFSDCYEYDHHQNDTYRVRCARSVSWEELSDKGIAQDTRIGERFDLNGEEVVFAGVDESGYALIVAAQDEPNATTWDEAMQAAEARNQRQEQLQEQPHDTSRAKKTVGPKM